MPLDATTLRKLAALSLKPEQMAGVLSILADMQQTEDERKTKQRERKARSRDKTVTVTGQERDRGEDRSVPGSPDKREIPQTPLEKTNPSSSLRSDSQITRAPEAMCRIEFTMTFWPAYPHQVSRPAAMRSFIGARQRGVDLAAIMAGLERYVRDKPPDRSWLNPATFLDEDRFDDNPASAPAVNGQHQPKRPASEVHTAALGRALARRAGAREREADVDVGVQAADGGAKKLDS